tara:strand:+ start:704 stop:865 length:162 start_codon:yes stop_codon:yes gene_type:complete
MPDPHAPAASIWTAMGMARDVRLGRIVTTVMRLQTRANWSNVEMASITIAMIV